MKYLIQFDYQPRRTNYLSKYAKGEENARNEEA